MLEEWLGSPAARTLAEYVSRPETGLAVLLPGVASLAILRFYARAGKVSGRLQLLWLMALPVSYYCARWESTSEVQQLYIYSAFSVTCVLLVFKRIDISPALAYALTFLSLWWVDVTRALCHAVECGSPLDQFYVGVGGAGIYDALFLVPLLTAGAVGYLAARLRSRGESLHSMEPSPDYRHGAISMALRPGALLGSQRQQNIARGEKNTQRPILRATPASLARR